MVRELECLRVVSNGANWINDEGRFGRLYVPPTLGMGRHGPYQPSAVLRPAQPLTRVGISPKLELCEHRRSTDHHQHSISDHPSS